MQGITYNSSILPCEAMPNSKHGHCNEQTEPLPSPFFYMRYQAFHSIGILAEVSMITVEPEDWTKYCNFTITTTSPHWVILQTLHESSVIHVCLGKLLFLGKVCCFINHNWALSTINQCEDSPHRFKIHDFCCLILSKWNCAFVLAIFPLL